MASRFSVKERRAILIMGLDIGMQGNDPLLIVAESESLDVEDIISIARRFGYNEQAGEKFAMRLLQSGVLFSDVPPAVEEEDESPPGMSTDSENFADVLEA